MTSETTTSLKSCANNWVMFLTALVYIVAWVIHPLKTIALAETDTLLIYQVQTGSSGGASQELVTAFNNSDFPIDVTNFCLLYMSSSGATQTNLYCLKPPNTQTRLWLPAGGTLAVASNEYIISNPDYVPDGIFKAGLSGTSGHIKIVDSSGKTLDQVGWGSATQPEGRPVAAHPNGKIFQRIHMDEVYLRDTNDNFNDFFHIELVLPLTGSIYEESVPTDETTDKPLEITELLPNAEGADAGKEFIEFYNPNDEPVNLSNYILMQGSDSSKTYYLPEVIIEPHQYIALTDTETGLVMPNTSSSLNLLSLPGIVVSSSQTYSDITEGMSWAMSDGSWKKTYTPTPGTENIITTSKPCNPGYYRNTETNACRKITNMTSNGSVACKSGQYRNIETGRCRKITGPKKLVSCKSDQIRNAETGRCRKIQQTVPKQPCKTGQDRNPATGRCRKKLLSAKDMATVKDVNSALVQNNAQWWAAGFAATGSAGYAAIEWRREITGRLKTLKGVFNK